MSRRHGRRRGGHEEEHENHERWLVTYADMVTLLMVLFIVMFAMSQVDQKKFNALKVGLAAGFGQSTSVLDGSSSILDEPGTTAIEAISPNGPDGSMPPKEQQEVTAATGRIQQQAADRREAAAENEVDRLGRIIAELRESLARHGLTGDVYAKIDERGLVLSLVSRHVVFEPDMATLSPRGRDLLDMLSPVLADLKEPLSIDGHTNQVKVKPAFFPSDWELSAARAVAVLRYLHDQRGIPASRLSATAYGHEKPLVAPSKPGSQAVNKRVDIVVSSDLDSETRALLKEAALTRKINEGTLS